MWEQYRKTAFGMQVVIFMVTLGVYRYMGHQLGTSLVFFITMQVCAIIGAMWAARLKGRFVTRANRLPLQAKL